MLSDEKIEELFNKDAFEVFARGYGTVDVIDFDCGMDFAKAIEKAVQEETIKTLEFKKDAEAQGTSDKFYDLGEGYIEPHKLLKHESDADLVMQAFALVQQFFEEADKAGLIEHL